MSKLNFKSKKRDIPYMDLDNIFINSNVVTLIPEKLARRYNLIAIDKKDDYLIVAMVDTLDIFALDDIKMFTEYKIKPALANKESIEKNIDRYYRGKHTEKVIEEFAESYESNNFSNVEDEELIEVSAAPVVKLINSIVEQAIELKASDIHIEPFAKEIRIRFRVDGELHEVMKLSKNSFSAIVSRIKIIGKMDISEKRIPQDGRIETEVNNKEIDMRISTIPTVYGEKVVIRLLDRSNFFLSKEELGFTGESLKSFDKILNQPYGMILVTGPTGSVTVLG